ncbi:DUF6868 family protein [sulfur-oxidizing endosymbiont of Gigantopelta aegis]|uniref:DUF6868 family protein n=1 Tax=sulfur-oxidizing endosymbiont of Gigantopelta aegis TaxID=2794934 RepID=UPI0018DCB6A7|nr:hypothetical protein [sulfur-oxidizing endosymbiont of Gigantopelta aegis]
MFEINAFVSFLGYCSIINISVFVASIIVLKLFSRPILSLHSQLFGVKQTDLPVLYMQYLGNYKIAILIFNLVPYLALKAMSYFS